MPLRYACAQGETNHEVYNALKPGLIGLTQSMAVSLGHKHRIRVEAIVPGWISVDNENSVADAVWQRLGDGLSATDNVLHPVGRVGRVDDVGRTVCFLLESEFVTGEEIVLDGGVTRKMVCPEE